MRWKVRIRTVSEELCGPGIHITDEHRNTITDTGALDVWPLNEAHRRLIEAAPDLFEACMAMQRVLRSGDTSGKDLSYELDLANDAINKAKGIT